MGRLSFWLRNPCPPHRDPSTTAPAWREDGRGSVYSSPAAQESSSALQVPVAQLSWDYSCRLGWFGCVLYCQVRNLFSIGCRTCIFPTLVRHWLSSTFEVTCSDKKRKLSAVEWFKRIDWESFQMYSIYVRMWKAMSMRTSIGCAQSGKHWPPASKRDAEPKNGEVEAPCLASLTCAAWSIENWTVALTGRRIGEARNCREFVESAKQWIIGPYNTPRQENDGECM